MHSAWYPNHIPCNLYPYRSLPELLIHIRSLGTFSLPISNLGTPISALSTPPLLCRGTRCLPHHGHQGLTVTPPVRLRFFPSGLTVAKSDPLATRRKVANHSPQSPEINKPQARISGVEISMCNQIDSNTCIEVTTCMDYDPARQLNNLVPGPHCTSLYGSQWDTRSMESAWLFLQLNTLPSRSR
jgi:hypothetical protein